MTKNRAPKSGNKFRGVGAGVLVIALIGGGFFAANYFQPQRFASAQNCVTHVEDTFSNICEFDVNYTFCIGEGDLRTCELLPIASNQSANPDNASPVQNIKTNSFACKAPFVPTTVHDANNRTLLKDGCARP